MECVLYAIGDVHGRADSPQTHSRSYRIANWRSVTNAAGLAAFHWFLDHQIFGLYPNDRIAAKIEQALRGCIEPS